MMRQSFVSPKVRGTDTKAGAQQKYYEFAQATTVF